MGTRGGHGCPSELDRFRGGGGDSGETQTVAEVLDRIKAIWRQFGHNAESALGFWGGTPFSCPSPHRTRAIP